MISKVKTLLISISLFIVIFLSSVELVSFDKKFYNDFQQKENIKETYGINEDLKKVNSNLIDFLRTGKVSLIEKYFNEKEVAHLIDCYKLYKNGIIIRNSSAILFVILIFLSKKDLKNNQILRKISNYQIILTILLICFMGFLYFNFDEAFIKFHHIFFDNNLWLLDPTKDMLIQLMPTNFFIECCIRIFIVYFIMQIAVNFYLRIED